MLTDRQTDKRIAAINFEEHWSSIIFSSVTVSSSSSLYIIITLMSLLLYNNNNNIMNIKYKILERNCMVNLNKLFRVIWCCFYTMRSSNHCILIFKLKQTARIKLNSGPRTNFNFYLQKLCQNSAHF